MRLAEEARQAQADGDYERAASDLERALRIERHNAPLWHQLARVHHARGNFAQAIQFANRSISLAGADKSLQADNWELIARSHAALGDTADARAARETAAGLRAGP